MAGSRAGRAGISAVPAGRGREVRPVAVLAVSVLALVLVAVAAGCGGSQAAAQRFIPVPVAARSYLAAHPAPAVRGMTAGIVIEQAGDVAWFCHQGRGSAASLAENCGYWAVILMTAAGRTVTFTCGSISGRQEVSWVSCTSAVPVYGDDGYVPEPGDYIYVPDGLRVTRTDDVRVIRPGAFDVWDAGPGTGLGVPAQCFPPVNPPAEGC